ncbi:cytidylyltransferase domain-containing protein [Brevundimonas sp.]|uniref:acylneuraminate cytidylyltransferase family protein n=1 Tax=Brevundimonas sp. TaxID=1871086 RepID=UPI002737F1CB|nr:acylneuraminate cytidylyltransferase family protein [Brevundimonas sp.]MDP3803015.1 acylneuraminate cytidylyltransferase family protein [Brevundimonas sp.]
MIDDKRVLGVITARGGSKGVPRKNLADFRGAPLLQWTIEAARECECLDRLILSSDDAEIIALAASLGCEAPFVRSPELASDDASSVDVVLDAAERVPGYDVVVLLQPTSPLRLAADIDGTVRALVDANAPGAVSVFETAHHPWLMFGVGDDRTLEAVVERPAGSSSRRQDCPAVYQLNGAVYAVETAWLRQNRVFVRSGETVAFVMPGSRSLDIDTLEDLRAPG